MDAEMFSSAEEISFLKILRFQMCERESLATAAESTGVGKWLILLMSVDRKWICSHCRALKLDRQSGKQTKKSPRQPVNNTLNCKILNFIYCIGFWDVESKYI